MAKFSLKVPWRIRNIRQILWIYIYIYSKNLIWNEFNGADVYIHMYMCVYENVHWSDIYRQSLPVALWLGNKAYFQMYLWVDLWQLQHCSEVIVSTKLCSTCEHSLLNFTLHCNVAVTKLKTNVVMKIKVVYSYTHPPLCQ